MKKLKLVNQLIILSLFLSSCSKKETHLIQTSPKIVNSLGLVHIGSLNIPLDSVTSNVITSFQHVRDRGNEYFTFINTFTNSIYYYNLGSNEIDNIRHFDIEGPNGVGKFNNVTVHKILNDSIIFYDRERKRLTIVDEENKVVHRKSFGLKVAQTPYGRFGDWLINIGSSYNFSTSAISLAFKEVKELPDSLELIYNPSNNTQKKSYLPLPDIYLNHKWLIEHLFYYRAFDPSSGITSYSFPADNRIFFKKTNGKIESKYMGSDKVKSVNPIPSISIVRNMETKMNYFFNQGSYGHLYFDPYRNLYFRYAFSGIDEQWIDINQPLADTSRFDKLLIISDSNFNKIGEFQNDLLLSYAIFFRPNGIYVLRKTNDEDTMTFDIYNIEQLNR